MIDLLIISLHADPSMPPGIGVYGGGHMYPKELLIGLSKKNYNVSLLTRKSYENLPNVEHININCTIYRLDYGSYGIFDKRDLYNLKERSYELAVKIIEDCQLKFQIIHSIYWNSGQLALQLGQKYAIPFVHSTISNGQQIMLRRAKEIEPHRIEVELMVFQAANRLFCITPSEKQAIIKYYHIPRKKIIVIGRPVDLAYRFPVHNDLGYTRNGTRKNSSYLLPLYKKENQVSTNIHWWEKKVFTYVGRIDLNKGIDIIISAWYSLFETYGESCPPLWIIGGTPDEINDFHEKLPIDLQVVEKSGKLIWWGTLDAEGISAVYLRTLAVIMHSKYEPGGRVSIEAMSEGVPVIATKCGFAGDMIHDWENGFLVDYGDIKMLSKRMEHFIWQPYLSCSLGIVAKKCADKTANNWDFLDSHIRIYNEVICGNYKNDCEEIQKSNLPITDYINAYPYINFRVDDSIVRSFAENSLDIHNFTLKESTTKNHCFCWNILLAHKEFIVYQPYSYMNSNVFLHDLKDYAKVQSAADRYRRHKYWSNIIPTDTLYCDDQNHLILCMKGTELNSENDLSCIIEYIKLHSGIEFKNKNLITQKFNSMLKECYSPKKIWNDYKSALSDKCWYIEGNSSYCLESQIILQILSTDKKAAERIGSAVFSLLNDIAQMYNEAKTFVISGFVSEDSSFYKVGNHVVIHDCAHLYLSWPGEDYAKLYIKLMTSNDILEAEVLLNRFPETSHQDIIIWSIIILTKHIILMHHLGAADEKFKKPTVQLGILKELHRRLQLT